MQQNYNRIYGSSDLVSVYGGIHHGNTAQGYSGFFTWNKPKGVRTVDFYLVGGGGGGGAGAAGTNASARWGGGGGGSGACTRLSCQAILLPDTLYVHPGAGGTGGVGVLNSNGGAGVAGGPSFILIQPADTTLLGGSPVAVHTLCYAGGGGAGAGGTNTAAAGGSAGTVGTQALMPLGFGLGPVGLIAGQTGVAGGNGTGSLTGLTIWTAGSPVNSGGAGGGGTTLVPATQSGGGITIANTTLWPSITGGAANSDGNNGVHYGLNLNAEFLNNRTSIFPLISSGGSGAGSTTTSGGVGGKGACGGFGSGGGGGGAGAAATVTGGDGGNGGPGLIIITCTY
jgi:hypothetical protein